MATADCRIKREDATIRRALRIIERRLKEPGVTMNSPAAVREYLALWLGAREHEVMKAKREAARRERAAAAAAARAREAAAEARARTAAAEAQARVFYCR